MILKLPINILRNMHFLNPINRINLNIIILFNGMLMKQDDYGKMGFGYWGNYCGFSVSELIAWASIFQILSTGKPDPVRDSYCITLGFLKK